MAKMRVAKGIVLLTAIVSFSVNRLGLLDCMLLVASSLATCAILQLYPVEGNWAKYLVLLGVWMPVVAMPGFHMVSMITGTDARPLVQEDYERLCSFGIRLYTITLLAWLVFGRKRKAHTECVEYHPIHISEKFISFFLIVLYSLTTFSYITGLGRMGADAVVLPFHLSGIINLFRNTFAPSLFVLIAENYMIRKRPIPRKFIVLVFGWCLFESLAWLSKAVLINYLLGTGLVAYLYYKPSIKSVVKKLLPLLIVFLVSYPIIEFLRYTDMQSNPLISNIKDARQLSADSKESGSGLFNPLLRPLNRVFMTGEQYVQDYDYINNDDFFDFSRLVMVVASGGAAAYQTFVIDGYPPDANHSSGTTGIMDPLLHGGRGLCYIVIVLTMVFSVFVDGLFRKQRHGIYVQLVIIVMGLILFVNLSSFYDGVSLQYYLVKIVGMYLIFLINYRKKSTL